VQGARKGGAEVGDYKKLAVASKAHNLTLNLYRVTESFPRTEIFGLTSQIRRASSSINANLAEGSARGTDRDFLRFVRIALGSVSELEYHLVLARDLNFVSDEDFRRLEKQRMEVGAMLSGLATTVKARIRMQVSAMT
jgi:four helix bundle protein